MKKAPNWTRPAAFSFTLHVYEEARAIGLAATSMLKVLEAILTSNEQRKRFLTRLRRRRPKRVVELATAIVEHKASREGPVQPRDGASAT